MTNDIFIALNGAPVTWLVMYADDIQTMFLPDDDPILFNSVEEAHTMVDRINSYFVDSTNYEVVEVKDPKFYIRTHSKLRELIDYIDDEENYVNKFIGGPTEGDLFLDNKLEKDSVKTRFTYKEADAIIKMYKNVLTLNMEEVNY